MANKMKLWSVLFLVVFAFITIIPTHVAADATVCQIVGGDGYNSLAEALSVATGDDTVKLLDSVAVTEGISAIDKDVTIDLNGFTLTVTDGDSHALYAKDGFTLTIDDADGGGKVIASFTDTEFSPACAETGGIIVVKGDLTAAYESGAGRDIIAVYAKDDSEITVNGTVSGYHAAIYASDSAKVNVSGDVAGMVVVEAGATEAPTVHIGGSITNDDEIGVLVLNGGKVTVEGTVDVPSPYFLFRYEKDSLVEIYTVFNLGWYDDMTEDGYLKYTYSIDGMQEGVVLIKKPEAQPIPAAVEGNIYVCNGSYTVWEGDPEEFDADDKNLDWTFFGPSIPITGSGEAADCNLYVLDDSELYFDDLNLGSGGVYNGEGADVDLYFEGGTLRAREVVCRGEYLWIDEDCSLFVTENIESGEISTYGCVLDVGGDIISSYIWFDSDSGPLYITVAGDILCGEYEQYGGNVEVAGDLTVAFFEREGFDLDEEDSGDLELSDDWAHHNVTELRVGGNVSADIFETYMYENLPIALLVEGDIGLEDYADIEGGYIVAGGAVSTNNGEIEMTQGRLEAASLVCGDGLMIGSEYADEICVLEIAGDITATDLILIFSADIQTGGDIAILGDKEDTAIEIRGGKVRAAAMKGADSILVGHPDSDLNDAIALDLDSIEAADSVAFFAGDIRLNTVNSGETLIFYDDATVLNAENVSEAQPNFNESDQDMCRVELTGLIPNAMAEITVESGDRAIKTFRAIADENGKIFVWLPEEEMLSGEAVYGDSELLWETGTISDAAGVRSLPFDPVDECGAAILDVDVPDMVFMSETYFGIREEIASNLAAVPCYDVNSGEALTGFSDDPADYDLRIYREGYYMEELGDEDLNEGDYLLVLYSEQTIGETDYLIACAEAFTVAPLEITVGLKGGVTAASPAIAITDNAGGKNAEGMLTSFPNLFTARSYAANETAETAPVYVFADCLAYFDAEEYEEPRDSQNDNPYYLVYANTMTGREDYQYSVRFHLVNGILPIIPEEEFTLEASASAGGAIDPAGSIAVPKGASQAFAITPEQGYVIDDVLVDGVSVGAVPSYTFNDVTANHTITASFSPEKEKPAVPDFSDVNKDSWYYSGIAFVVRNQIFLGTSATTFSPAQNMSRAMMVTVLYRMDGEPAVSGAHSFGDVLDGKWFSNAVVWASKNGLVKGYSAAVFGPADPITREQMAVILHRYAQFKNYDLSANDSLKMFSDAKSVSPWALEAMKWAVGAGLIEGVKTNTLQPAGKANRAQVATIIMRFSENIIDK